MNTSYPTPQLTLSTDKMTNKYTASCQNYLSTWGTAGAATLTVTSGDTVVSTISNSPAQGCNFAGTLPATGGQYTFKVSVIGQVDGASLESMPSSAATVAPPTLSIKYNGILFQTLTGKWDNPLSAYGLTPQTGTWKLIVSNTDLISFLGPHNISGSSDVVTATLDQPSLLGGKAYGQLVITRNSDGAQIVSNIATCPTGLLGGLLD